MEFGFSGEGFANLLFFSSLVGVVVGSLITLIAGKRGVNTSSIRFKLKVLGPVIFLFIIFPLWLSDLNLKWKAIATIATLAAGIINYIFIEISRKSLKNKFKK
jgi:type III secretory pathway component EscS